MVKSGKFFGTYAHNLDAKFRLMLPKKLKLEPGTTLYLMRGYDGAFEIHTSESFAELFNHVAQLPLNKKNARLHTRLTLGSSEEVIVDNHGRIQIPVLFVEKYNLKKEVYLVGVLDHLEVWDKDCWMTYEKEAAMDFEENAQGLGENENE